VEHFISNTSERLKKSPLFLTSRGQLTIVLSSDGSGSKFFDPGQIGSGQPFMVWGWKIFPKNVEFLNFSLRVKQISFGGVKKCLGQRQVGLLFTAGQKYAWVGSELVSISGGCNGWKNCIAKKYFKMCAQ